MTERKDRQYEANVLAHIAMHKSKGETEAVKGHMAVPAHRAIVKAAADKVPTEPEGAPDSPDDDAEKDEKKGQGEK